MMVESVMVAHCKHASLGNASILTGPDGSMLSMDTGPNLTTLGKRIEYALEHSGHSNTSAANLIGCKPQAISQWISGATKNIKNDLLFKFAEITGFEARWIVTGEGPPQLSQAIRHTVEAMKLMQPEQQYLVARLADQVSEPKGGENGTQ